MTQTHTVELSSNAEFESWLEKHGWFEGAFVRELAPIPDTTATHPPTQGYLKLGLAVGGSFARTRIPPPPTAFITRFRVSTAVGITTSNMSRRFVVVIFTVA